MDKILFVGLGTFGCKTLLSVMKSLNMKNYDPSRVSVFGIGIDNNEWHIAPIAGKSEAFWTYIPEENESPFSYFEDGKKLSDFIKYTVVSGDITAEKIRVVVITSLAESMGKDNFIQTGLALRKFLYGCKAQSTIYGAFVLESVLPCGMELEEASTNVKWALNELKAVTDVKMGAVKIEEFEGDRELYCMDEDFANTRPVYDASFMFDAKEWQKDLENCTDIYVRQVSHFITSRFVSEAAATFNTNEHIDISILGKMGKFAKGAELKLEYPQDRVIKYCILRTINKNLLPSFSIAERELMQRGVEGENYTAEYIKIFEKQFENADAGSFMDRLREQTRDVKNSLREDEVVIHEYKDKATLLMTDLEAYIAKTVEGEYMQTLGDYIKDSRAVSSSTIEKLKDYVLFDRHRFSEFIEESKTLSESIGDSVAERLLYPYNEDGEEKNPMIAALLSAKTEDGEEHYAYPAAAKYMLLKFYERCREVLSVKCNMSQIDNLANDIRSGHSEIWDSAQFVSHNKESEKDYCPLDVIERRKLLMVPSAFISKFAEAYADFCNEEYSRCARYLSLLCEKRVLERAMEKLLHVADAVSSTYDGLNDYTKELERETAVSNENVGDDSVLYVYATAEAKEEIYKKLCINDYVGFTAINDCIVKNGYERFLISEGRLTDPQNKDALLTDLVALSWRCVRKYVVATYFSRLGYDIYGAMFKECDMHMTKESLEAETDAQKHSRYEAVLFEYFTRLYEMAKEKLSYDDFASSDYRKTIKTVLSVHPDVSDIARGVWERMMPRGNVAVSCETKNTEMVLTCQLAGVELSEIMENN